MAALAGDLARHTGARGGDLLLTLVAAVAGGFQFFFGAVGGGRLILIRRGTVRIVMPLAGGRQHHLVTFTRADFFGDMAFLDDAVRSADAVASTATDLYVLSRGRSDAAAKARPEMAKKVFPRLARALAIRLRQTDAELRALEES